MFDVENEEGWMDIRDEAREFSCKGNHTADVTFQCERASSRTQNLSTQKLTFDTENDAMIELRFLQDWNLHSKEHSNMPRMRRGCMSNVHKEIRVGEVCDRDKTDFQTMRETLRKEAEMMINDGIKMGQISPLWAEIAVVNMSQLSKSSIIYKRKCETVSLQLKSIPRNTSATQRD